MRRICVLLIVLVLFFENAALAKWEQTIQEIDTNSDGIKDAEVYLENSKIVSMYVDLNADGQSDTTIFYKNGIRVKAEVDSNLDTLTDTWVEYDKKGDASLVRVDLNADNLADHLQYIKSGMIYKKQWDRNFDGHVDAEIIYAKKPSAKLEATASAIVLKKLDKDFDGKFEIKRFKKQEVRFENIHNTAYDAVEAKSE